MKKFFISLIIIVASIIACNNVNNQSEENTDSTLTEEKKIVEDIPVVSSIEILEADANKILDTSARVEELAKGFSWSEGPLWVDELNALLFSDVPENKIYKWTENEGLSVFINQSGFTDTVHIKNKEGSNGLALDSEGDLVICQHGNRQIAMLKSGIQNPVSEYISLAKNFEGKKFNSPNDLAISVKGDIYFTDPPYGLKDEKDREIEFNGVYRLKPNGEVVKLVDSISRPNGIAFSPDEKTIYVANSDPDKAVWYVYQINEKGNFTKGSVFFDAGSYAKTDIGLPDGLKVHKNGTLFATGPGGVYIISPKGKLLARIKTSKATANCAFDSELQYLYMTTTDRLLRIKLK